MTNLISALNIYTDVVLNILLLLAGLGVFLFGLKAMGDNLENIAGSKMRKVFDKISNNRFVGMGVGAGVTAVIQSSSATTVMVVGFVNAGVMSLMQATPIIMGANIGTTITAFIVVLKSFGVSIWMASFAAIGAFMMMFKKEVIKQIGAILAGLGMIFVGLEVMSGAMEVFQGIQQIQQFIATVTNPFILLFIGLAFTGLIQSSSATTSILITMASAQLIGLQAAMFVILGCNMGTCVTAMLASIGANPNARRAALIHFLFNFAGALIFLPICQWVPIEKALVVMAPGNVTAQIAIFHLFFNAGTTLLLMGFVKPLVKIAERLIPDKKSKHAISSELINTKELKYIDSRLLSTPVIAINATQKEILNMASVAKSNLDLAVNSVLAGKVLDKLLFEARENHLNFLNKELSKFLVNISSQKVSFKDEMIVASFYHVVSDIERIGDYAENIIEYSEELHTNGITFSDVAISEIQDMYSKVLSVYHAALTAFEQKDISLIDEVIKYEDQVDQCKSLLNIEHIKRLNTNQCTPTSGAIFLSLISNLERIADHMENIANSIKDYSSKPKRVQASIVQK